MWNPFSRRRKEVKELKALSKAFVILDNFAKHGELYYKEKDKLLLIEEDLAIVQISRGADSFRRFLSQVCQWQSMRLINNAYETQLLDAEIKALHKAREESGNLTEADIKRIRQAARDELVEMPTSSLPVVDSFDIMIIRANAVSIDGANADNGQLLAVGHYENGEIEMAMFDDVKQNLVDNHEEE